MFPLPHFRRLPALALATLLAGCGGGADRALSADTARLGLGRQLIACPNAVADSGTVLADPLLGGTLSIAGASIAVPPGAVSVPTLLHVVVPVSSYAEVRVSAEGVEHLLFDAPVAITIDYSRCARPSLDLYPLVAWYVETDSYALLERMGGTDDKSAHRVTFTTGHLSSYALAE